MRNCINGEGLSKGHMLMCIVSMTTLQNQLKERSCLQMFHIIRNACLPRFEGRKVHKAPHTYPMLAASCHNHGKRIIFRKHTLQRMSTFDCQDARMPFR